MRVALNGLFLAFPATGTGQYLRELVRAMRAQAPQDEFVLLAPHDDPTAPAALGVHATVLKQENFAKLEFEQITFPRASRNTCNVAHVPHFGPPLFSKPPTVVTIHDLIPLVLPTYRGSIAVRLYTHVAALGARRAQAILADSYASARDIARHLEIPKEKIHVVYLAAHARYHPPQKNELERVRAKYGLPEQFALYLGGFDERKNVARVIEAFAGQVQARREGWKLVLAGRLPDGNTAFFPDPRIPVERLGVAKDVYYAGFVQEEDKPALYAAARVFLYPSRYEGFGLPPLEAMACGTPVIAANTASLPEVVGEAGVLLDPDDANGWSRAIEELLQDKARWDDLRARGLKQVSQFSWERAARETLAVYRAVV